MDDIVDTSSSSYSLFTEESVVTASAWMKGISLSILASIIGGASKLAIRKSWLLEQQQQQQQQQQLLLPHSRQATPLTSFVDTSAVDRPNANSTVGVAAGGTGTQYREIVSDEAVDVRHDSFDRNKTLLEREDENHNDSNSNNIQEDRQHYYTTMIPMVLRTLGMIGMTSLNPLCSVLAMNYASPSILAPFSGLTLVWIVLFSQVLVGEQPTLRQVIAAGLIVIGEVVIAIFGDHTNDEDMSIADVVRSPIFRSVMT
jgi:hypothetical protein